MRRAIALLPVLLFLGAVSGAAQESKDANRLGLSCRKILAMTPDAWAEYFNKKQPGGEAGYDQAYETYASCMKVRNGAALAKLPQASAVRLRNYRELCRKFREDGLELAQAYAGGGTAYTHATVRGQVDDERLVARLATLYASGTNAKVGALRGSSLARVRSRLIALSPTTPSNRKRLAEFSTGDQGDTAYKEIMRDLTSVSGLLASERLDARGIVVKFLDNASRGIGGM